MKNIFLILIFSLTTIFIYGQSYSDWLPIISPHTKIVEVTSICGDLFATDEYNLWHSVDTGKTWQLIDFDVQGIPGHATRQKVFCNPMGIAVIRRTTSYPGTGYTYGWDCFTNNLILLDYKIIGSNGYDSHQDISIVHDNDEFLRNFYRQTPNPNENFCFAWKSSNALNWTPQSCDVKLIPDTIPSYTVKKDSLYKTFNNQVETIAYIPDIVLGHKTLSASIFKDNSWYLAFQNGQISKSFDQGLNWDTCAYMTPLANIKDLWKTDYGIYFHDCKITSPTAYHANIGQYTKALFRHKNNAYRIKWNNIYVLNPTTQSWTKLYYFPQGKLAKTENALFYYGKKNNTNFIFSSNDAGQHWQIHTAPSTVSTMVATESQWFIFDKENQTIKLSGDIGQTWTDVSIDPDIDTIYTYQDKVFLIGANSYYAWNKQNTTWLQHAFTYPTYPMTDLRVDEFLLFRRESQGDSLFNYFITDLTTNQSREVVLPEGYETRKNYYWAEFVPGAHDYLLNKGLLYICDGYNHHGIQYSMCTPSIDTLYVQAEFCPEQGLNLGDTTLFLASTDTIQYLDHFHSLATAILDISPYESIQTIQKDTSISYGDKLFGQQIFTDTIFSQFFYTEHGCNRIIEWNVSILVANHVAETNEISVFPNPSFGRVSITSNKQISNIQLNLINILGEVIHTQTVSTNTTIDLTHLPQGSYYLIFEQKDWKKHLSWIKI